MNNYDDKYYLEKCKVEIEKVLGIGDSVHWKQRDYEYLCKQLYEKLKINISLSTIKRIWSSNFKNAPQPATLNALAEFLGYEDWNNFKKTVSQPIYTLPIDKQSKLIFKKKAISKKFLLFLIASFVILYLGFLLVKNIETKKWDENLKQVQFELKKTDVHFPNSVIFYYDIGLLSVQKLTIQQSWDHKMTVDAAIKEHYRTCIYYYPGYYNAKLIADGIKIKETDLILSTSDWVPLVIYTIFDSIPQYIHKTSFKQNKEVYLPPDQLIRDGIKTDKDYYLMYSFCKDFNQFNSDNFIFETKIRNSIDDGALLCQNTIVYLACTNGWICIPFTSKGCVSDLNLYCSELYLDGKRNDLSAFGFDMDQWHTIRFVNKNKNLNIFVDGKLIYTLSYKSDLGNIYEIGHLFKGCGRFKDVFLKKYDKEEPVFKFPF